MSTSVPLASNELARRADGAIECRVEPMRLRLELPTSHSKDHHDVRCTFECSVRIADNSSDRRLLVEVLLADRDALRREDVTNHLVAQIRSRIEELISQHAADDVLSSGPARDELLDTARTAIDAAAFACGLIVLPPYQLDVQSGSVQRARVEKMQRVRAEERSSDQVEHLRRAGELLKQFQSVRESSSDISPGQILERIAPADRGSTLEALLAASSHQDGYATLWAVAGPFLVRIEPGETSPKTELIQLPTTLGPLRSVQPATIGGRKLLLIGARDGIIQADRDRPLQEVRAYRDPELKSESGFNRAALWNESTGLWATHADGGVVAWGLGNEVGPHEKLREYSRARNLQILDSTYAVFSAGNQIVLMDTEDRSPLPVESNSTIVSIVPSPNEFIAVHEDGLIVRYDRSTHEAIARENRGGRINASCALPWLGSIRLLLARDDGAIECVGVDDQLVTQYFSVHRGYKMLAANASVVAAVSSDRQRLILWHSWDGRKPFAELHLTSQTRHRIADIEFG